jgi:hypothetical protein
MCPRPGFAARNEAGRAKKGFCIQGLASRLFGCGKALRQLFLFAADARQGKFVFA